LVAIVSYSTRIRSADAHLTAGRLPESSDKRTRERPTFFPGREPPRELDSRDVLLLLVAGDGRPERAFGLLGRATRAKDDGQIDQRVRSQVQLIRRRRERNGFL